MKISIDFLKNTVRDFLSGARTLLALVILILILLVVWLGIDIYNKVSESENRLIISATGEVYAQPDLALTTFSVVTEAKTVSEALSQNTEKMNAVIDFIKSQGVQDKDLKTTAFNISPRYEWYDKASCPIPCPPGQRVLVGYEVRQSLQVKIRELTKIGQILEGATQKGANQVDDLQFTIDNQDELKKEARAQAIEKAKDKAKTLASQLGVRLVRVVSFQESVQLPYYYDYGLEKVEGLGGAAPQIEPGENKITVSVTVTYQIR